MAASGVDSVVSMVSSEALPSWPFMPLHTWAIWSTSSGVSVPSSLSSTPTSMRTPPLGHASPTGSGKVIAIAACPSAPSAPSMPLEPSVPSAPASPGGPVKSTAPQPAVEHTWKAPSPATK